MVKYKSNVRLDGKTIVITGCNTGIGKETVKDFYKRGGRVIMACRNIQKTESAAADILKECKGLGNLGEISIISLDLSSFKSIRECAQKILDNERTVDILVNNAGVALCPYTKTEDGLEMQIGTNHFGHFLFTLLLLPKIISSAPARIVNVSSSAHRLMNDIKLDDLNWEKRNYSSMAAYSQSKLANVYFTKELTRRLKEADIEGVTTYALHPGAVATDIQRHLGKYSLLNFARRFFKTPEEGAQTTIYCSIDEKIGKESGMYYDACKRATYSKKADKVEDTKKLWEISLKMVGLPEDYNPFVNVQRL